MIKGDDLRVLKEFVKHLREADEDVADDEAPEEQEAAPEQPSLQDKKEGTSLDSQVDRFLINYEKQAKSQQSEAHDHGRCGLYEAGEVQQGSGKMGLDDINLESFANDVQRLINNYDNLLEIRNTIARRASNFLRKQYDDDVIGAFEEVLREEHGIDAGDDSVPSEEDHTAQRAWGSIEPGATGGGGGIGV
jgi:hypothetical protein